MNTATQAATEAVRDRKRRRQETVLKMIAGGRTVREAVHEAGISHAAYYQWRESDKTFAAKADKAKLNGRNNREVTYDGSFSSFRKKFFGLDSYAHHLRIIEAIEQAKPMEVTLVLVWPEAGKTTVVEDWVCKKLAEDPNHRVTYLSQSEDHAKKCVGHIQDRMTDVSLFPDYIARFGPFAEEPQKKPWSQKYMTVAKSSHDERDYSLAARAVKSKAYGTRVDTLIADDLIDQTTWNLSESILDTLVRTYLTRGMEMRTVIIGTRIQPNDLYGMMIERELIDRLVEIPALEFDPKTGEEKIVCPEMWTGGSRRKFETPEEMEALAWERVNKRRNQMKSSEASWDALYMQNPRAVGEATFAPYVDRCLDHDRTIEIPSQTELIVSSLDPALGGGCALLTAQHEIDQLILVDLEVQYGLSRTEEILSMIETTAMRYQPQRIIIEQNAFQKGLVQDDRLREISYALGFSINAHTTGRNKLDQVMGVASMAGDFMRGEIRIPWGDDHARARFEPLVQQLRDWRPTIPTKLLRQDAVMALWFNRIMWVNFREAIGMDTSSFTMRGLPYRPTPAALTA